ncbi:MAG: hypothetical protein M1823_001592 [Watsoniomyces obsoletus]|nr:MAG: hypothetical protein M1823_001592 [Watsoniomyces obsoletus]
MDREGNGIRPPRPKNKVVIPPEDDYRGLLVGTFRVKYGVNRPVFAKFTRDGLEFQYRSTAYNINGRLLRGIKHKNQKVAKTRINFYKKYQGLSYNEMAPLVYKKQKKDGRPPLGAKDWVMFTAMTNFKWIKDKKERREVAREIRSRKDALQALSEAQGRTQDDEEEDNDSEKGTGAKEGTKKRAANDVLGKKAKKSKPNETEGRKRKAKDSKLPPKHTPRIVIHQPVIDEQYPATWSDKDCHPFNTTTLVKIGGKWWVRHITYEWLGDPIMGGTPNYGRCPRMPPADGYVEVDEEDEELWVAGGTSMDSMTVVIIDGLIHERTTNYKGSSWQE